MLALQADQMQASTEGRLANETTSESIHPYVL